MSKTLRRDFDRAYNTDKSKKKSALSKQELEKLVLTALKENEDITKNKELMEELMKIDHVNEFPEDMYGAVAEILAFIYSMDAKKKKESQNSGEKNA
jgi:type III secretion system FlhB-like substrate exporter